MKENHHSIEKLETFFKEVSRLTSNHDVIDDYACVTADKLGNALSKVDPEWWKNIPPMTNEEYSKQIKK